MNFRTVPIKEILTSPSTNSGLKKKHVEQKRVSDDYIPVYSASKDENYVYGWIKKNSKWKKYKNVLTWVKDGSSSGYVSFRNHDFAPYEKLKILKLKDEYEQSISYLYLKTVIQNKLLSIGYGFGFKCSMERVMETEIKIPINDKGEYDLPRQIKLHKGYSAIDELKTNILNSFSEFEDIKINIDFESEFKKCIEFPITDFLDFEKGKALYTQQYIRSHQGDFPVYSSQTTNDGIIGSINTYDHNKECLTWTTDGIYAGTIFYRKGKFNMTTHCGAIVVKKDSAELIDLKYIYLFLLLSLKDYAIGEGNKRLTVEQIEQVKILLPITNKKTIDIDSQRQLVNKYFKIYKISEELNIAFKELSVPVIEI